MKTKSIWYKGKITSNLTGVNQKSKPSFSTPSHEQTGFDNHAEADPVKAKTINIIMS